MDGVGGFWVIVGLSVTLMRLGVLGGMAKLVCFACWLYVVFWMTDRQLSAAKREKQWWRG